MSMISTGDKIQYSYKKTYNWIIPAQVIQQISPAIDLDKICKTCDSIKDKEIQHLRGENEKLKKLVHFLREEIKSLELKTALSEKAIPLKKIVEEFTSTAEGKTAWDEAWKDQFEEWHALVKQGKMSRIKYYRLINGIDQITLAKKLGTAQPNISRIEKPGYNVPTKTLKQLTEIFAVKMEDLIGD